MRRRDFITLLGGAAAWPRASRAQQSARVRRLGMLIGGPLSDPAWGRWATAFREELAKLGWIEGGNLRIDLRFVAGTYERSLASAAELVSLAPDVIFASSGVATRAAEQLTKTIPIIFTGPSTVIGGENVARPAGNITGFPILYPSIAGKWVALLKETDPRVSRVAYVSNNAALTGNSVGASYIDPIEETARSMTMEVTAIEARDDVGLERAVESFAAKPNGGLIILPSAFSVQSQSRDLVRRLAERYRLPTIHWDNLYPAEGGLMSYGSDFEYLHRRAAMYVDRILRGAKVSDLPIERPTRFQLVLNLRAAKAIDLVVPSSLLAVADEVIE
jgi:putative ABC transport system substrate-binding protein